MLGQDKKAEEFAKVYDDFVEAVDKVLWNATEKVWLDLNIKTKMQNTKFYPSNLAPLWANCYR